MDTLQEKILYLVIVHLPHRSIVNVFEKKLQAYSHFCDLLTEISKIYGDHDFNGASLNHCRQFGYYQINHGYFLQMYETTLNSVEEVKWI